MEQEELPEVPLPISTASLPTFNFSFPASSAVSSSPSIVSKAVMNKVNLGCILWVLFQGEYTSSLLNVNFFCGAHETNQPEFVTCWIKQGFIQIVGWGGWHILIWLLLSYTPTGKLSLLTLSCESEISNIRFPNFTAEYLLDSEFR